MKYTIQKIDEAVPGIAVTDKAQGESKKGNKEYYSEVKKKMADTEKEIKPKPEDKIDSPKYEYPDTEQEEYHRYMEIMNGLEMFRYDNEPSDAFKERARMGIEGGSKMGNAQTEEPVWGGATKDFGKKLVKSIEASVKKRNDATNTFTQFGDDIELVPDEESKLKKKKVAIGESTDGVVIPKKPIVRQQDNPTEPMQTMKRPIVKQQPNPTGPQQTMKQPIMKQQDNPVREENGEITFKKGYGYYDVTKFPYGGDFRRFTGDETGQIVAGPVKYKTQVRVKLNDGRTIIVDKQGLSGYTPPNIDEAPQRTEDPNRADTGSMVKNKTNSVKESEVNPKNTHFLVEKGSGKIMFAWDYSDVDNEDIKEYVKTDIKDMFPDKKISELKLMTKAGLLKQNIDPMDSSNWIPQGNNNEQVTETKKMKRAKFKTPFNGIDTALKVIPESYKVDKNVFEMTDGNENYKIRWEGDTEKGKAIVLEAYDKSLVKEDVDKIFHLMRYNPSSKHGNLKGKDRVDENVRFFDLMKKSVIKEDVTTTDTVLTEGEKKK